MNIQGNFLKTYLPFLQKYQWNNDVNLTLPQKKLSYDSILKLPGIISNVKYKDLTIFK